MPNREAFLVTGVAGSGKTTLCSVFSERGHVTYDVDKGFASWVNRSTGQVASYSTEEPMTLRHDWLVDREKLQQVIEHSDEAVWFFGSAYNLYQCTDLFRNVFLLQYPDEQTLRDRILHRDENDYGKAPGELDAIVGYWHEYEDRFINLGATAIDCSLAKNDIYDQILNVVE